VWVITLEVDDEMAGTGMRAGTAFELVSDLLWRIRADIVRSMADARTNDPLGPG